MTEDERERRQIECDIRQANIFEMLKMDGVPPDLITAVALLSLGVRMHHDILQDNTRLANILQEWADGVREGLWCQPLIVEPKRKK